MSRNSVGSLVGTFLVHILRVHYSATIYYANIIEFQSLAKSLGRVTEVVHGSWAGLDTGPYLEYEVECGVVVVVVVVIGVHSGVWRCRGGGGGDGSLRWR